MNIAIVTIVTLLVITVGYTSAGELEVIKEVICGGSNAQWEVIKGCYVKKIPPTGQKLMDECRTRVAPEYLHDDDKFRKVACFEKNNIIKELLSCGVTALANFRATAPKAEIQKAQEIIECVTEMYFKG